jgi:hypothetical protein
LPQDGGKPRPSWAFSLLPVYLLAALAQPSRPVHVYDGFESPVLSKAWNTTRILTRDLEIQSAIVRAGRRAARIALHPGDQLPDEKGTILERAELMEAYDLVSYEDRDYSYSFSILLPRDFPVVPTRLVIAQWKQFCPSGRCRPDNPVLALRYQAGELRLTLRAGPKTQTLFRTKEEIRGRWLDLAFRVRFSRGDEGRIQALLNGRSIADYKGPTAYAETYGYPPRGRFYFKTGLYRDRSDVPMTIYLDEYRKRELPPG